MRFITSFQDNFTSFTQCISVIVSIFTNYKIKNILLFITIPFLTTYLNISFQRMMDNDPTNNIIQCLLMKFLFDYISSITQNKILYEHCEELKDDYILRLNLAKFNCGVSIPGCNQKDYDDLLEEKHKLRDFLFLLPILWSSIVSFCVSIYNINIVSDYPIRLIFFIMCILLCFIMTYMNNEKLYEKTKPDAKKITLFNNTDYMNIKISMGCEIDIDFEKNKKKEINKQQNIQHYFICFINFVAGAITLYWGDKALLNSFCRISWMLGWLSDNIKSFKYHTYMRDFIRLYKAFEKHTRKTINNSQDVDINKVVFRNASFGYYDGDLREDPNYNLKIVKVDYTFKRGNFYYLEAPNGEGKSTLLNMFSYNLHSGNIYFGSTDRNYISDIKTHIFRFHQASEYTPKFTNEELKVYKGRDLWLENMLGLTNLLDKDTIEMSGGQKKRVFIYIALTSLKPQIILLDEILSELSTEETPEVPEGGGWLNRVINTLVNWDGLQNKIMILVGHGLTDLIPKRKNIIGIKINNLDDRTIIF